MFKVAKSSAINNFGAVSAPLFLHGILIIAVAAWVEPPYTGQLAGFTNR
ncbi:hypothetical protein [Celerinatantimonas sp. YJH-8]